MCFLNFLRFHSPVSSLSNIFSAHICHTCVTASRKDKIKQVTTNLLSWQEMFFFSLWIRTTSNRCLKSSWESLTVPSSHSNFAQSVRCHHSATHLSLFQTPIFGEVLRFVWFLTVVNCPRNQRPTSTCCRMKDTKKCYLSNKVYQAWQDRITEYPGI